MIGGFNTNVPYQGRIFHVQTEDSGLECPHVVTLLYEGGAILCSKKTEYGDCLEDPDLESRVRQIMEEQHRWMLQALKSGRLDGRLGLGGARPGATVPSTQAGQESTSRAAVRPEAVCAPAEFGAGILTGRPLHDVIQSHLLAG